MIVVDTNVVAWLIIGGPGKEHAEALVRTDPVWIAPPIWRSEFRNVLVTAMRVNKLPLADAKTFMDDAEARMRLREHAVLSEYVLELAALSRLSAYDCEFVALAVAAGVPLITADRRIVTAFPETARLLSEYAHF